MILSNVHDWQGDSAVKQISPLRIVKMNSKLRMQSWYIPLVKNTHPILASVRFTKFVL